MNTETNDRSKDIKREAQKDSGFNWQRYKSERRELHAKLVCEQEKTTQPENVQPTRVVTEK